MVWIGDCEGAADHTPLTEANTFKSQTTKPNHKLRVCVSFLRIPQKGVVFPLDFPLHQPQKGTQGLRIQGSDRFLRWPSACPRRRRRAHTRGKWREQIETQANTQTSFQAGRQAGRQAGKQENKEHQQASKQASKKESKQARKQESKNASQPASQPASHSALAFSGCCFPSKMLLLLKRCSNCSVWLYLSPRSGGKSRGRPLVFFGGTNLGVDCKGNEKKTTILRSAI